MTRTGGSVAQRPVLSAATTLACLALVALAGGAGCKGSSPGEGVDAGPDAGDTGPDAGDAQVEAPLRQVTILHTADLHNRASGRPCFLDYTPLDPTDQDSVRGGYARLATLIKQTRAEQATNEIPVLLFDSGDFLAGSVYDLFPADPLTLRFFQLLLYDAVTLGDHEFDWLPAGLSMLINNAAGSPGGFDVPIVASNMVTDPIEPGDDDIEALAAAGVIVERRVLNLPNGLRVGVLGRLGPGAASSAIQAAPLTFDNHVGFIQSLVNDLRFQENVHLVVVISHGGIREDGSGDDVMLAVDASDIDVILSGHHHEATPEPIELNGTLIFSPGWSGEWLSRLDVSYDLSLGEIVDYDFELLPVDDTIAGDATVQALVETYDSSLLPGLGLTPATPIVEVPFDLPLTPFQETGIGNLVADAMRTTATMIAVSSGDPTSAPAVGFWGFDTLADGLHSCSSGTAAVADLYNVIPWGWSLDPSNPQLHGNPLISFCLFPAELKDVAEVHVSIAQAFGYHELFVNISGFRVEYDPYGPTVPPDRVHRIWLCGNAVPEAQGGDGDIHSLDCTSALDLSDQTTLVRAVSDLYSLAFVREVAMVGVSIAPKYCDGTPIIVDDVLDLLNARIDRLPGPPLDELWLIHTLLDFLGGLPDDGGIPGLPEIPSCYDELIPGPCLDRFVPI
ncbi:MAG: metallophosphoesterase [bacterium]